MTFSTPVTPTRDSPMATRGVWDWTSRMVVLEGELEAMCLKGSRPGLPARAALPTLATAGERFFRGRMAGCGAGNSLDLCYQSPVTPRNVTATRMAGRESARRGIELGKAQGP